MINDISDVKFVLGKPYRCDEDCRSYTEYRTPMIFRQNQSSQTDDKTQHLIYKKKGIIYDIDDDMNDYDEIGEGKDFEQIRIKKPNKNQLKHIRDNVALDYNNEFFPMEYNSTDDSYEGYDKNLMVRIEDLTQEEIIFFTLKGLIIF